VSGRVVLAILVGTGLGMGAKDFRLVFVLETAALDNFINSGWDADAHAEAMAKISQKRLQELSPKCFRSPIGRRPTHSWDPNFT